jgi:hypothetical protein
MYRLTTDLQLQTVIDKSHTRLLLRGGASQGQNNNYQTVTKVWS